MINRLGDTKQYDLSNLPDHEFAKIVDDFTQQIENNDVDAEFSLGGLYLVASPNQRNIEKAIYWLKSAAEKGHAEAQLELSEIYSGHTEIEHDFSEAFSWCLKAAEQGVGQAQNNLGTMYRQGLGVPQDDAQAIHWLKRASENGSSMADTNLGVIFATPGKYFNIEFMLRHLTDAAYARSGMAMGMLAQAYYNGFEGHLDMDYDAAHYWAMVAAQHDDITGLIILYRLYRDGKGVEENHSTAIAYLKRATEKTNDPLQAYACYLMGQAYQEGAVIDQNFGMAIQYYEQAVGTVVEAEYTLGMLIKQYADDAESNNRAFSLLLSAKHKGYAAAAHALGQYYEEGKYVGRDFTKAATLYLEALAGGYTEAAYELVYLFKQGLGVPKSLTTAHKLTHILIEHVTDPDGIYQLKKVQDALINEMTLEEFDALSKQDHQPLPDQPVRLRNGITMH
ncbi:MAG: tetratricopeptide repeat protein [Hafnia sp.]